jgi:hypothetical protein
MTIYNDNIARPYVYKITHKITKEYYYGYRELNANPNYKLIPAHLDIGVRYKTSSDIITKHGFENFGIEILCEFEGENAGDLAFEHEQFLIWLNWNDTLLLNENVRWPINESKRFKRKAGWHHTPETCKKVSDNHADVSGINNPMYGKKGPACPMFGIKRSKEFGQNISRLKKGVKRPCTTGDKHPKYDKTIHSWYHPEVGCITCTRYDLVELFKEYKLYSCCLQNVVIGKNTHHKGWTIQK